MPKKLKLFFDLDNTLVHIPREKVPAKLKGFFTRNSAVLPVSGFPHYVFPGVRELLQFLLIDMSEVVEVSFFSAAQASRNEELVPLLLRDALGETRYLSLNSMPEILSRQDLSRITPQEIEWQNHVYGLLAQWAEKKDLIRREQTEGLTLDTLTPEAFDPLDLESMILIDDSPNNIMPGQEGNFLCSPFVTVGAYEDLNDPDFEEEFSNPVYRAINSIFYVTGVLLKCIEEYQSRNCVRQYLFELQFEPKTLGTFIPKFEVVHQEENFYRQGLACLQTRNKRLTFAGVQNYIGHPDTVVMEALHACSILNGIGSPEERAVMSSKTCSNLSKRG